MGVICIARNTTAVDILQVAIKYTFGPQREKMYLRAIFEQKKNNVTLNVQRF